MHLVDFGICIDKNFPPVISFWAEFFDPHFPFEQTRFETNDDFTWTCISSSKALDHLNICKTLSALRRRIMDDGVLQKVIEISEKMHYTTQVHVTLSSGETNDILFEELHNPVDQTD